MKLMMERTVALFAISAVMRPVWIFFEFSAFCMIVVATATSVPFFNAADKAISTVLLTCTMTKFGCSAAVSARPWWRSVISFPKAVCRYATVQTLTFWKVRSRGSSEELLQ